MRYVTFFKSRWNETVNQKFYLLITPFRKTFFLIRIKILSVIPLLDSEMKHTKENDNYSSFESIIPHKQYADSPLCTHNVFFFFHFNCSLFNVLFHFEFLFWFISFFIFEILHKREVAIVWIFSSKWIFKFESFSLVIVKLLPDQHEILFWSFSYSLHDIGKKWFILRVEQLFFCMKWFSYRFSVYQVHQFHQSVQVLYLQWTWSNNLLMKIHLWVR